jgi:hypothetical protein
MSSRKLFRDLNLRSSTMKTALEAMEDICLEMERGRKRGEGKRLIDEGSNPEHHHI